MVNVIDRMFICRQVFKESQGPLASSLASVQVDFNTVDFPDNPDTFQNDGVSGRDRKPNQDPSLLSDILIGIPLNDEKKLGGGGGDLRPNKNGILSFYPSQSHSALEIGMYVLLSTFCFAIVVFVVSCFVYASKHKMINVEHKERTVGVRTMPSAINREPTVAGSASNGHFPILRESRRKQHRESTTNAHNWVWLGRSTMDHSSIIPENSEHFLNPRGKSLNEAESFQMQSNQNYNIFFSSLHGPDSRIRITRNPIPANYMEAHDSIQHVSTFEEAQPHFAANVRLSGMASGRGQTYK